MNTRSPWRDLLYRELATLTLQGEVIDLGGSRKSAYHQLLQGDYTLTVGDLHIDTPHDIELNLEKPFPIHSSSYDGVLSLNLLEHIYNFKNVVDETFRILKPEGEAIFAVPFLLQVHPSPHDHWRFTKETLEKIFREAGYGEVEVRALGTGSFGASAQMIYNILYFRILRAMVKYGAFGLDYCVQKCRPKAPYGKDHYPLGYIVRAKKYDA